MQYSILTPGTGKTFPAKGDAAMIRFHEWLSDGTLIDGTGETRRKRRSASTSAATRCPTA